MKQKNSKNTFPMPSIAKRGLQVETLNLSEVNPSRECIQRDVLLLKREADRSVSKNGNPAKINELGMADERTRPATVRSVCDDTTKSLYAWKMMVPRRPSYENIGTLDELEAYLDASGLPGTNPSKPIIERTRLMQHEGQGYYKEPTNGEGWSLLWVELRAR
ncbi:hypothetical protein [Agrobacterium rosae]